MSKKIFGGIIVAALIITICVVLYHKAFVTNNESGFEQSDPATSQDDTVDEEYDNEIVEIPVDSVKGITQQEAESLCLSVMGEKDEETGFMFSFGASGAVKTAGKQYYVIRVSWLVNNSHLSYIGDLFVLADGTEVYSGTALQGEYIMEDLIWKKQS